MITMVLPKAFCDYRVSGKVNLSESWQHQIFLATVNKLDDYYNANPEDIIQVGTINQDGTFTIQGNNLPLEKRYYRLYLVKEENSEFDACLYVGGNDHNFIHLILDNNSNVHITADRNHYAPFGNYTLEGDRQNQLLKELSVLIFPSFYFYQIRFPSELQFSEQKLNRDLFEFSDTCSVPLVSLAAILNTDMDKYFESHSDKYHSFGERLKMTLPEHNYTNNYFRKMRYYGDEEIFNKPSSWPFYLIGLLSLALLFSLWHIRRLLKINNQSTGKKTNGTPKLTSQEQKILELIVSEKSNKEIAAELFIELSTVKTHINKLYAKMEVKNRAEAKEKARFTTSS